MTKDPMMDELLKGVATSTEVDPLAEQPTDALEVVPAKPLPIAKRADAVHSTSAPGGKGFRCVVRGEYYALAGNDGQRGKVLKPYEITVNVPKSDGAMGVIVRSLLLPAIKKLHPEATGYRTHELVSIEPLTADTPAATNVMYMTRPQLLALIVEKKAPIDVAFYTDTSDLRSSLVDFLQNPLEVFTRREEKRKASLAEKKELAEMNPDVAGV